MLKKTSGIDCPARTVKEETLQEAVAAAINQVLTLDEEFFETFRKSLDTALGVNGEEIEEKLADRQRELIALSPRDERYNAVADEIYELREQKRRGLLDEANQDTVAKKVEELISFIREQRGHPVGYN